MESSWLQLEDEVAPRHIAFVNIIRLLLHRVMEGPPVVSLVANIGYFVVALERNGPSTVCPLVMGPNSPKSEE